MVAAEVEEAGTAAVEVVVEAAQTVCPTHGAPRMTSQISFALWGGRFSAVTAGVLIGRCLADPNYNSRQASVRFSPVCGAIWEL